MRRVLAILSLPLLMACGNPVIPDTACRLNGDDGMVLSTMSTDTTAGEMAMQGDVVQTMADAFRQSMQSMGRIPAAPPTMRSMGQVDGTEIFRLSLLAITTGGQNGSFSSGVLDGWTGNGRPDFSVVTGASAGGLIAPVAFAGSGFDNLLTLNAGIDDRDVIRRRSVPALLSASALYSTRPLEQLMRKAFSPELIGAIRQRSQSGAVLLIGATNLDTGRFERFDIARMVSDPNLSEGQKSECLVEAALATSAIPALFPPRRIGGSLYADAGVRQHVFLEGVQRAIESEETRARSAGRPIRIEVDAYLLVNSTLALQSSETPTGILSIAGRSAEIVSDEGLRQSVLRTVDLARSRGWRLRGLVTPALPPETCPRPAGTKGEGFAGDGLFSACVTQALFDVGRSLGASRPIPWMGPAELVEAAEAGRVLQ